MDSNLFLEGYISKLKRIGIGEYKLTDASSITDFEKLILKPNIT